MNSRTAIVTALINGLNNSQGGTALSGWDVQRGLQGVGVNQTSEQRILYCEVADSQYDGEESPNRDNTKRNDIPSRVAITRTINVVAVGGTQDQHDELEAEMYRAVAAIQVGDYPNFTIFRLSSVSATAKNEANNALFHTLFQVMAQENSST